MKYSRIMRFRNDRIAKILCKQSWWYLQRVDRGETVFTIKRERANNISSYDKGCYIVVWEK